MARQAGLRCSRVCCVLPALQRSKAQRGVCGERPPGLIVRGVLWHCEEIVSTSGGSANAPLKAQVRPTILLVRPSTRRCAAAHAVVAAWPCCGAAAL
eukprot:scaffold117549_cov60-Phaeocystis_antarctica.AAC.2